MTRNTWPLRLTVLVGVSGYVCAVPTKAQSRMLSRAGLKDQGWFGRKPRKVRK